LKPHKKAKKTNCFSQADPTVPAKNTRRYFEAVMKGDPSVHSYYRHFEAPGLGHCYSGTGLYPAGTFDSVVRWVEQGIAPDKLDVDTSSLFGPKQGRILCPHPKKAKYKGTGGAWVADSYVCA
jgi:hypothetical protein